MPHIPLNALYMKNSQLNRVLKLVRHTGDRMIIMDLKTDEAVVMMRLPEYENLIGTQQIDFTLEENLRQHTDPDSDWQDEDDEMEEDFGENEESQAATELTRPYSNHEYFVPNNNRRKSDESGFPYFNGESKFDVSKSTAHKQNHTSAQKTVSFEESLNFDDYDWTKEEGISFNEESLSDIPEEEEEEKFYLEPVE